MHYVSSCLPHYLFKLAVVTKPDCYNARAQSQRASQNKNKKQLILPHAQAKQPAFWITEMPSSFSRLLACITKANVPACCYSPSRACRAITSITVSSISLNHFRNWSAQANSSPSEGGHQLAQKTSHFSSIPCKPGSNRFQWSYFVKQRRPRPTNYLHDGDNFWQIDLQHSTSIFESLQLH